MSVKAKAILSWVLVVIIAVFIFWMSAKSGIDIDKNSGIFSSIKEWLSAQALAAFGHEVDVSPVGHFCEYLAFGAALCNALRFHMQRSEAGHAVLSRTPAANRACAWVFFGAVLIASLYGVTDEFHQIFTPGRSCDPADWAVDTIAAAVGAALVWGACAWARKRATI